MMTYSEIKDQKDICNKFGAAFVESPSYLKIGISRNVKEGTWPVNGLRHPVDGDTTGWYIWAGEELPDDPDFFVSLHVEHLKEWRPEVIKYLGLAPGWRFLVGENSYEDVSEDLALLKL